MNVSKKLSVGDLLIDNGDGVSTWEIVQILMPRGGFPHVRLRLNKDPARFKLLSAADLGAFCRPLLARDAVASAASKDGSFRLTKPAAPRAAHGRRLRMPATAA